MTLERWASLWSFLWAGALAFYLFRVAQDPSATRAGRLMVKALDSWFLSARWSAPPSVRLRQMAFVAALPAAFMLYLFIVDPERRYPR
jgi:hypothetical protein